MPITAQLLPGVKDPVIPVYNVANSVRLNRGDSANFTRTPSSASNRRTWTWSGWVKRSGLGNIQTLFDGSDGGYPEIFYFDADDKFLYHHDISGSDYKLISSQVFRDVSAWMHIVVAKDTTQSTETDRLKVYVNGSQITMNESALGYPTQNFEGAININDLHIIGNWKTNSYYVDGYLCEVAFIDGTQLDATSFGEFDSDSPNIWKPIDVSGLTFGTNGFYLDFEDSSNLGNDVSGNNNDYTPNNLAATDQATDTCTNNFCTMNPLYAATSSAFTFSEGNCVAEQNATAWRTAAGTMGVSSGKWYFEAKGGQGTNGYTHYGWCSDSWLTEKGDGSMYEPTTNHNGPAVTYYGTNGKNYYSTSSSTNNNTSYGASFNNTNTIGCFLDLDNNKAYWSKDGTLQNSGTGYSIESGYTWFPVVGGYDMDTGGESVKLNFGGCPATTISSGNTDGKFGIFEYSTTITGDGVSKTFKALCTKNLSEFG